MVRFRISRGNLEALIPLDSIWITIAESSFETEELLEMVLAKGFNDLKHVFELHDKARMLMEKQELSLADVEAKFSDSYFTLSFFAKESGCYDDIEVWTIDRTVTETIARVGRDNRIDVKGISHNRVFIKGYLIEDPYLYSFVPDEDSYSHSSYGWVPSSAPEVSYSIEKNAQLTRKIKEHYNAKDHYRYLKKSGLREINYKYDHLSFTQEGHP